MKTVLLVLVLGLLGGAAGGYYGRPALDRAILGMGEVEGVVVSERREGDRLLLTLRSGDETIVASFVERADDVAELVSEGDTVTVRVGARGVFADDVPILRLRRAVDGPEDPDEEASEETDEEANEEAGEEADAEAGEEEADEEAGEEEAGEEADAEADAEADEEAGEEDSDEEARDEEADPADEPTAGRVASAEARRRSGAEAEPPTAEAGDGPPPAEIVVPASIEEALAEATRRARARRHRRAAARRGRTVPAAAESEAEPATIPSEPSRPVAEAAAAPPHEG